MYSKMRLLACIDCHGTMALPIDGGLSMVCDSCKREYFKTDGVWDFRADPNTGSQKSLAIYAELEFQRWLEIFEHTESKNWKIYETKLYRFFTQSGHRLLGRSLAKLTKVNDLVVEVGAGNGALHDFVALKNYIGIDTNWNMLCQLATNYPDKTLICTSGGVLPIADGIVDTFVTLHTLEHIYHLAEAFEEITRILKPEGTHYFVIPCEGGLPFSIGRALVTGPSLKRKYSLDIDLVMSREHINDAPRVLKFLKMYFRELKYTHWPLRFLPFLNTNVMIWGHCKSRPELLPLIRRAEIEGAKKPLDGPD
ncbi:class I SAM-dependent methyltransferase [Lentilitoribacter sp. Alg239-R112]|uniref:class I SAM-dependent methyltransferase n=1 Tax=Lentilitoribacter sp. Alg239-R112 TaxID=2305987 RepID=UPI0013A6C7E4|nr:class I SAM-dependent methyltransferase [Lentilitoribacter sp. Alg239-R112]